MSNILNCCSCYAIEKCETHETFQMVSNSLTNLLESYDGMSNSCPGLSSSCPKCIVEHYDYIFYRIKQMKNKDEENNKMMMKKKKRRRQ